MDQLLGGSGSRDWFVVAEGREPLASERDTTEPRDQRLPALATVDADLHALARPVRRVDRGLVPASHFRHR